MRLDDEHLRSRFSHRRGLPHLLRLRSPRGVHGWNLPGTGEGGAGLQQRSKLWSQPPMRQQRQWHDLHLSGVVGGMERKL